MQLSRIDLHTHTTESDGTLRPEELIEEAHRIGLSAIAITDHDTVNGIPKALPVAEKYQIELVPGIEFSTDYNGKEVHIVGLYIDMYHPKLQSCLKDFRESRNKRNEQIVINLQKEGFDITMEKLLMDNPDCVITRANIARYLYEHGMIPSIKVAFEKYIGDHCKCYVNRFKISPMEVIPLIKEAGGVSILAHPLLYHLGHQNLQKLVDECKAAGLDGIEAIYSTYSPSEERAMCQFAKNHRLLISGGSDFHGTTKPNLDLGIGYGKLFVPHTLLDDIKAARIQGSL